MEFNHKSVLLEETIESLNVKPDGIYVDGTLGGGGHAFEVCKKLSEKGRFIGIDQDDDALKAAAERLSVYKDKVRIDLVKSNYVNIKNVLDDLGIEKVDGILLDIGVSSYQIDTPERGFSYKDDGILDMRMDRTKELTAEYIINNYDEMEIYKIIRDYGEDKFAKNIAKHIAAARKIKEIKTTTELTEIIKAAIPAKIRMAGGHPGKKTFQALRIEVNKELEVLENSIDEMIELLNDEGRLSIITFHSLEDRIVKLKFRELENPCTCPKEFPVCVCGKKPLVKVISKKGIAPTEKEIEENPRSRSAKLRIIEKL